MDKIRLATEEEIDAIKDSADLTPTSRVLVLGNNKAVWRVCHELDPVIFDEKANTARRYQFIWGIENIMKGSGVLEYYFNVPMSDDVYRKLLTEHLGAIPCSKEPEMRYKIVI